MSIIHHTMCYKKKNSSPKNEYFQDGDEFVSSSDLEKCSIASLSQQWMLCSEWVPSEWESDKNITIIHTTPVKKRRQKLKQIHN